MEQDTVEWRIGSLHEEVLLWRCRWGGTVRWRDVADMARRGNSRYSSEDILQHISVGQDLIDGLRDIWRGAIVLKKEIARNWRDAFRLVEMIQDDITLLR